MKSPIFHRQDVLEATLQAAVDELKDPVEGLQALDNGDAIAWSRTRAIYLEIFSSGAHDDGAVVLGGGGMTARYVRDCNPPLRAADGT